jgi:hypothetical protein
MNKPYEDGYSGAVSNYDYSHYKNGGEEDGLDFH